jgi:hypothetical protein
MGRTKHPGLNLTEPVRRPCLVCELQGLGLGLSAAVKVHPPLRSVRVVNSDVEAEAPVRALGTTACQGSSGLTTGDHTEGDVARSAARSICQSSLGHFEQAVEPRQA